MQGLLLTWAEVFPHHVYPLLSTQLQSLTSLYAWFLCKHMASPHPVHWSPLLSPGICPPSRGLQAQGCAHSADFKGKQVVFIITPRRKWLSIVLGNPVLKKSLLPSHWLIPAVELAILPFYWKAVFSIDSSILPWTVSNRLSLTHESPVCFFLMQSSFLFRFVVSFQTIGYVTQQLQVNIAKYVMECKQNA